MTDAERATRALISCFLDGEIDAVQLSERLPDGWELDEADDPGATDLALYALGYLAGYQSGDRTEDELREALRQMLSDTVLIEYAADDLITVLAASVARFSEPEGLTKPESSVADTSREEGYESAASQNPRTEHRTTTVLLDRP
jgi:hypothetical protein